MDKKPFYTNIHFILLLTAIVTDLLLYFVLVYVNGNSFIPHGLTFHEFWRENWLILMQFYAITYFVYYSITYFNKAFSNNQNSAARFIKELLFIIIAGFVLQEIFRTIFIKFVVYNPIRKVQEVVHTYGWYMRKFINDAKAKGAIAIVCSPIPRNDWKDGKVSRSTSNGYAKWAEEVATSEGVVFINLKDLVATKYEAMGAEAVKPFFPDDHTHTNMNGAKLNAQIVVDQIKAIKPGKLQTYLRQ